MLIGGFQKSNTHVKSQGVDLASQIVKPFCDDEPIVMHAHVRAPGGGSGVSGANVSLTLAGTSLPQYSGTTDGSGDFTFDSVVQGTYHYKIVATGYVTKTANLSLHANTDRTDTLTAN